MSRKREIKQEIEECEGEIEELERKRERSQVAIMRAWLEGNKPPKEDAQYFTVFSQLIDQTRDRLRKLYAELEEIKKKK